MSAPAAPAALEQLQRRTFAAELEVRAASKGGDGRTIEGIAVPWDTPQRISPYLTEQFARGAFNHQLNAAHRIGMTRDHYRLIGRAVEMRDDAAGQWIALRVSKTDAGEETLELVRDGVLTQLSVGFRERQNRRLDAGEVPGHQHVERVTANLVETAVVFEGAYGEHAEIAGVRHVAGCACAAAPGPSRLEQARALLATVPVLPGAR